MPQTEGKSETPLTDAVINEAMLRHPRAGAQASASFYEDVHQHLAPLARDLERRLRDESRRAFCAETRETILRERLAKAQAKLSEAEKEAARLDWMERNQALISVAFDGTWTEVITVGVRVGIIGRDSNQLGVAGRWRGATLREAIDAARATETGGRDERNVSGM